MKARPLPVITRLVSELATGSILAPERYLAVARDEGAAEGTAKVRTLDALVVERRETIAPAQLAGLRGALVFDTTHARDGVLDLAGAARASRTLAASVKKRFYPGDLLVSRLRPYLRQVAFAAPSACEPRDGEGTAPGLGAPVLACSTEFFVLAPRSEASLAHLVPWLLSSEVQAALAAAQEGGHHPRVPRAVLLALALHEDEKTARARSRGVLRALDALYRAQAAYQRAVSSA